MFNFTLDKDLIKAWDGVTFFFFIVVMILFFLEVYVPGSSILYTPLCLQSAITYLLQVILMDTADM